jgi:O-antigen/teichoic acid export membrane protein
MLSDLKTTLKHSSIYGITNIFKKGAAFFMIPVYTHCLMPSDYGTLELLELTLDVAGLLVGLRMADSIIRYYNHYDDPEDQMQVISTAAIFSLIITILAVCVCQYFVIPISRLVFGGSANFHYLKWIFLCLGFQIMFIVPETFLIVKKKSALFSSISFGCFVLSLSLNIYFLVILKMGIWGMIYSMVITKFVNMLVLFIFVVPKLKLEFCTEKLIKMLKFGFPLLPGAISMFIINFSDRFFIQKYCDSSQLGIYSLGYKFGILLVVLISDPFFKIWNTQRFEIAKKKDGQVIVGQYFTLYFLALVFFATCISVFSGEIIRIMAESSYQGASLIIPLIALSYVFQGIANFSMIGAMVSYKTRFVLYSNVMTAFVNIGLNLYLIPKFGIFGAAVSTILTFLFLFISMLAMSQRLYAINFEYLKILKIIFFAVLLYSVSLLIHVGLFQTLVLKCILCAVFIVSVLFGGIIDKTGLNQFKRKIFFRA